MNIELVVFYFFAALVLGTALLVVTVKNLVRSIFLFFVTLFAVAGIYTFALADFVAVAQVIIYVGGVLVLMLFAFMLSNKELLNDIRMLKARPAGFSNVGALLVAGLFCYVLIAVILQSSKPVWLESALNNQLGPADNTLHTIGINLMTTYLLPFEVVSVFLMMALIGAAHLARKEKKA